MEFSKSFDQILKSVENVFNKADVPTNKMYLGDDDWENLFDFCNNKRPNFLRSGLTKFVLDINEEDDFVIKIPFAGSYSFYRNQDERYQDYPVNHCKRELDDYNYLKDTEINFLFVPTYYVGKVGELEIYIQPKVEPYSYDQHSASEESYTIAADIEYCECTADDEDSIAAFVEAFGDEAEHILNQLDDMGVRDIHCGNFGYQDGRLVIFDYCGYHS